MRPCFSRIRMEKKESFFSICHLDQIGPLYSTTSDQSSIAPSVIATADSIPPLSPDLDGTKENRNFDNNGNSKMKSRGNMKYKRNNDINDARSLAQEIVCLGRQGKTDEALS